LAGIDQPIGLQFAQRFAHNRARHPKGRTDFIFRGQLGTFGKVARDDLFKDLTIKLIGKLFALLNP